MSLRLSRALAVAGALLTSAATLAQLPAQPPRTVIGARVPALSPDGKRLAFTYRGDIWLADATGGRAVPLTRNVEMDSYAQFSPDGNWISFSSTRTGNYDVFVVPTAGGTPQRLTWHSGGDTAYGWSPDGKQLVMTVRRETGDAEMMTLDVRTLKLRKVAQDYNGMGYPSFSPDGKSVVFGRYDAMPWIRARYTGSVAMQIGLLDLATGKRRHLTDNGCQHLWPRFLPDGKTIMCVTVGEKTPNMPHLKEKPAKFVDSPARTPNLWFFDLQGKGRQVTRFVGGSVRFPNVASQTGDIVFEYGPDLWMLRAGAKEPVKIALTATEDDAQSTFRREVVTTGVTEAEPSPDGKTYAFAVRGEIWSVPVERAKGVAARGQELAKRLTNWVGADHDFLWAADGKKLYYRSDRDYTTRLFEVDAATGATKQAWNEPDEVGGLRMSPDGKTLAFWVRGENGGLVLIDTATGTSRRVFRMPDARYAWQSPGDITWSPDGKWYALTIGELGGGTNVWVAPTAEGEPVNLTRLNAWHGMPVWTPDGKNLLFSSNRDGSGLYVVPLTREPAALGEVDVAFEKPKDPVTVEIDFTGITRRIRKLTTQSPQGDLTITPEGLILFLSEGDVWSCSYDGKEVKRLTTGGGIGGLRMMKDGKKLFFIKNGELWTMKLEGNNPQERITFSVDYERDVRAERRAAFHQFWGAFNTSFHDANMHGRDWVAIRKRYEPMLEGVETRGEFSTLLGMMVGELESSHSEVGAAPGGNPGPSSPHLGFTYDYAYEGPGIKIDQVPAGMPGAYDRTRLQPGEYVMAVNGTDVTLDENLYKVINDHQGRVIELTVNNRPSKEGARIVRYACPSYGRWSEVKYDNRIARLRDEVEKKSNGALGYVHISGMGGGNQTLFEREVYEHAIGKKGMVIDVRFNGGGNISDTLINWLERKPHGYYWPRGGLVEPAPGRAWTIPIVVLMNEHSWSNAEMFPYAMRARGLARLVGMPTVGYVIWTWGLPLVDGTSGRMPGSGVYRLDGTSMENRGEEPDVKVELTADDWLADRDPQLDKAIELLLK